MKYSTLVSVSALVIVFVLCLWDADRCRTAAAEADRATVLAMRLADHDWRGNDAEFEELIAHQRAAVEEDPDDVQAIYSLCHYRWLAIDAARERTGNVHFTSGQRQEVRRIVDDALVARNISPTFGPLYLLAGEMESQALSDRAANQHFRQAFALMRNSADACRMAAIADAGEGRWDDVEKDLRHLMDLAGDYRLVIELCVRRSDHVEVASELCRRGHEGLFALADALEQKHEHLELARRARAKAMALWTAECAREDAPAQELIEMARKQAELGNADAAAGYFRRAIDRDYSQVQWHMELAHLLAGKGDAAEAAREARISLRLNPQLADARKMVIELSAAP